MAYRNILASGTGAGTSSSFEVGPEPRMVAAFGTLGSDTGDLEVQDTGGGWSDVYDTNGQVQLAAARPQILITAPGTYRVSYSARAAAIGVDVTR
jgi:hypothetical protein